MAIELRLYDGTTQSQMNLHQWMKESALSGRDFHILGGARMVVHAGDTIYRTEGGGFGVICHHQKWAAYPYNVQWDVLI